MHGAPALERYGAARTGSPPKSLRCPIGNGATWAIPDLANELAGEHRLLKPLASGGFGRVFLAEHVRTGAMSAVKVSAPGSRLAACILEQEAAMLSQIAHPNIVRLRDHGELDGGAAYLAMEYARGVELETWLEQNGPMPPARALGVFSQLAAALDHLHARGLVHADLKPSHLILDEANDDTLTLLDFGCAFDASDSVRSCDVGGTPGYMAPEQISGSRCTPAADIYAMAALATEVLTGRLPHPQTTRSVQRAAMTEPPALPSARGLLRPGLDEAFARALRRKPRERFASAGDFVGAVASSFAQA